MWAKSAILSDEEKKVVKQSLYLYSNKHLASGGLTPKQEQLLKHIRETLHLNQ